MQFAIDGTTKISQTLRYDVVIIGAGLAGLYTALHIGERHSCLILAKDKIDISNSWFAQGGIAAAISSDDAPIFHLEDTLIAGAGLCDKDAVGVLVDEGPTDISRLVSLSVPFDIDEFGDLQITREGGHRKNRIVHAGGDATGRETVKALAHIVAQRGNISFSENTCFYDILKDKNGAVSSIIVKKDDKDFHLIETRHVVIATGGIGQVYRSTTNPSVATGDGLAAAMRAGAEIKNIEFIQFHPTGLWSPVPEDREFLISEAVRGEGGLLKNRDGVRFMEGAHELNELAPRDIVARAVVKELQRSGDDHVFVDITAKSEDFLKKRFPTIYEECLKRGINIAHDWIPVCPVQHYLMGGIATDTNGRTSIPGLYAAGEAANTGVHGANRLASNSMLECLVFGRRAAEDISRALEQPASGEKPVLPHVQTRPKAALDYTALRQRIKDLMSEYGYVMRNAEGLRYAIGEVTEILRQVEAVYDDAVVYLETLNIATVALAILTAALNRPESIGSHYREDTAV
ncbi:L-aspartate oxidase [Sporobacter termitidis DSM 10068]|uniref:L-aspartate oxidase n=1 Tax=Sporobacter termitidis DSM 10068 TaxID=1123282 RepID=A0A1M5TB41_9FIRM|nr:L-aspartate oxidase [Sporobacter termitidis]SHH47908.1 L-aspartate oxidase [Sporobacter termitidis DSM 10068]